jgi:thiol-disulfide isomerase/thioredoxin
VQKTLPIKAADEGVTLPVKIEANTSMNVKFSYLVGMQLGNNFGNIGRQFNTEFEMAYFELGILDGAKKSLDSTFSLQMSKESLDSIGVRYRAKMDSLREEAIKKQREEEEKLKAEVAGLRGDTLVNGMPAKMNPAVKVTGVSYSGEKFGEFANRPLFVFYFSTTCPHCRHAAPEILAIADEFAKDGLTTLAVASGGNPKRGIRTFIDDLKWNDNIKVGWDEHRQFGELYSDGYVPKIYLVNPDGSYKLYGSIEREKDQIKEDIKALLGGKNVEWKIEPPAAPAAPAAPAPAAK